jgi:hypothetical protein
MQMFAILSGYSYLSSVVLRTDYLTYPAVAMKSLFAHQQYRIVGTNIWGRLCLQSRPGIPEQ